MASALQSTPLSSEPAYETPVHANPLPPPFLHSSVDLHPIDDDVGKFDCSICLDACRDPVVTMCGHLFCWPCLYCWLSLHSFSTDCPVCKADVQHKIIPLYGCRNSAYSTHLLAEKFPGVCIPSRPSAAAMSIAPIRSTSAMISHRDLHGMQAMPQAAPSSHSGFVTTLGFASLPHCFFGGGVRISATALFRRRRFNNEEEFVLHWGFISIAWVAICFFLLC